MKSFIAMVPLCFLGASCPSEKQELEIFHPIWSEVNDPEDNLPVDQCLVTKLGVGRLRFHVADHQQPFNSNDFCSKSEKNIVQAKVNNWVLTPNFYGSVTQEKFPQTMKTGIKSRFYNNKEGGIPVAFLEEWLAIEDHKGALLIISTGIEGHLGLSEPLKKALKDKKEKGEIQDYYIRISRYAVRDHNKYVKEGKKVFTFIHTGC